LVKFVSKPLGIDGLKLEIYPLNFSLDRLVPGVDNTRYDVYLSPDFVKAVSKVAFRLIVKHAGASESQMEDKKGSALAKEMQEFITLCKDLLQSAINKTKMDREVQINILVQTAISKIVLEETTNKYDVLVEHYKNIIREHEMAASRSISDIINLKEELSSIQQKKRLILRNVMRELFLHIIDIQDQNFKETCVANFGSGSTLSDDFFSNPLLHCENLVDDSFMIENYVLLGNRLEDSLRYDLLIALIREFFREIDTPSPDKKGPDNKDPDKKDNPENKEAIPRADGNEDKEKPEHTKDLRIDSLISQVDNIDILINSFKTLDELKLLKKEKAPKTDIARKKSHYKEQKRLLNHIYKKFNRVGLVEAVASFYEMHLIYLEYCPPLFPQDVLQFIIAPKERRNIVSKLKLLKGGPDKSFSLKPLQEKVSNIRRIGKRKKEECLIRFLRGFVRYHRDFQNYKMLKEAMGWINLVTDDKTLNLSRANHTLYEFLLPHESVSEEKPVINHAIIKTDVRGSTDITHQIKERGLNPAYYFSLNFFDPITEILDEYGASKVFIEGDALILSISENEDTPIGWYGVARACGLAIKILLITQRYNVKNKKSRLPMLEQGVGICYLDSPPSFLFDGNNRIMISPAINLADRLSGCARSVRKIMRNRKRPFNLYVFKSSAIDDANTVDDQFLRFNVNGIELNEVGFKKLFEEINLKTLECTIPEIQEGKIKIHTGRFPTMMGKYQRLVIREAMIPEVNPSDLSVLRMTDKKYYEVCTNTRLYEYAKKMG
jgi:hypothetical protein